jgi:2',3'-cyclic-nucleotide 2'-phosphodiesterase (5'-nucleotidase family)
MIRHVMRAVVLSACGCAAAMAFPLTILYTADLHVRLDRAASLSGAILAERESGAEVLLLDAGDAWHDYRTPISSVWGARETAAWMSDVSYTAMALGNHDTYWGPGGLSELMREARFPVLCANWTSTDDRFEGPAASVLLQVVDATILLVGLITAEFLPVPAYPLMRFRDPADALREQMALHNGLFDLVFVVAHVSLRDARVLARDVAGIHVIVSGHSHERTEDPIREGTTLIVQSGAFGDALGRLLLDVDATSVSVREVSHELIPMERTPVDKRAGVLKLCVVLAAVATAAALWLF